MESLPSGDGRPVVESLMGPLVVVLVDPAGDGVAGFSERLVFVKPDFFLLERAVKAFDAAVAFGVIVSRVPVGDAQPAKGFKVTGRSKLGTVVGRQSQSQTLSTRIKRQNLEHGLVQRSESVLAAAAQTQVPADDFASTAVEHGDQISPTHSGSSPEFGHVGLPDEIRMRCFHRAPVLSARDSKPPAAEEQAALAHYAQHALAVHAQAAHILQPPLHAAIAEGGLVATNLDDALVVSAIGTRASRLPTIVQTGAADLQGLRHQLGSLSCGHQLVGLRMNLARSHSPRTFFSMSIWTCALPKLRSSSRMRLRCSSSGRTAVLLPPSAATAALSASSFQR